MRLERKISQAALARQAGISITTLNEIETRRCRDIRLSTLSTIARTLGVSVNELLNKSDLKLNSGDRAQLLKASEAILRITRKIRS